MSEQDAEEAAGADGTAAADEAAVAEEEQAEASAAFDDWLASVLSAAVDDDPDDDVVEHVSDADEETLAAELTGLRSAVADLQSRLDERAAEVDDLESRLARKQADFQNYKQRQQERLEDEKARATEDLVERLLDVRDNLARALEQDEGSDIRGGVESTLRQLDREFEREAVSRIEPDPGEPTDPARHEVLMRVESDQPEDAVADVHRPGYEMAGKVLRPAQVTVSDGPAEENGGDEPETDASSEE